MSGHSNPLHNRQILPPPGPSAIARSSGSNKAEADVRSSGSNKAEADVRSRVLSCYCGIMKPRTIDQFHASQAPQDQAICDVLRPILDKGLSDAESKIWHGHPVWFLNGNPIVGYSKLKDCVQLMFWSGADFDEPDLRPGTGKFKDASIRYTDARQVDTESLVRWLEKSRNIQWDYKNIYKRKGRLERLV